jgi:hypothetical protein
MQSVKSRLKKILVCFSLFALLSAFSPVQIRARDTVDKIVATVGDGIDTELITYSDLLWQLALTPNASLNPPTSEDLNRALQILINQRLFSLEAERLPRSAPNKAEVDDEIKDVLTHFTTTEFIKRLNSVGFDSVSDDNFERMMAQRVSIKKYLDFRFRSFVVITPQDEANYYRDVFTPDFRRKNPGLLMPPLEEMRSRINQILTEQKIAADIEKFLDDAKSRSEIVVLSEV